MSDSEMRIQRQVDYPFDVVNSGYGPTLRWQLQQNQRIIDQHSKSQDPKIQAAVLSARQYLDKYASLGDYNLYIFKEIAKR